MGEESDEVGDALVRPFGDDELVASELGEFANVVVRV